MRILEGYHWPGNVRELENVIERALALAAEDTLGANDLPAQILEPAPPIGDAPSLPAEGMNLEQYLDEIRKQLMAEALDRAAGVQTQAADVLGMSFRSFRYYARKMGLTSSAGFPATEPGD